MTARSGDALLYAASAAREMSREAFKRIVDATCVPSDSQLATEMKYVRNEAALIGDALGHWEVARTGTDTRIVVSPPVLARLPWPGLPRAVLCGSRSPDTIAEIAEVCGSGRRLSLSTTAQLHHPYAPTRVELCGESEDDMIAVGGELSVRYAPIPPAWSIANASGSVASYLKALEWKEREDLNWDRSEFDPEFLRFGSSSNDTGLSRLRLLSYTHPGGWDRRDWLWNNGASAEADRSWGRYCVLASVGRTVLHYDHRQGVATVPRQVPLPKLLARALALSSGQAPRLVPGIGIGLNAYPAVPRQVFEVVAAKLHQDRSQPSTDEEGAPT